MWPSRKVPSTLRGFKASVGQEVVRASKRSESAANATKAFLVSSVPASFILTPLCVSNVAGRKSSRLLGLILSPLEATPYRTRTFYD